MGQGIEDEIARRLHQGPLQTFYASIMMLEGAGGVDADMDRIVEVLRGGAAELAEIIDVLDTRPPTAAGR